ncbi:MAG: hypothetical protein KJZ69_05200 [Phycisphaerales bacterium]|nr:hypothetical protein [Phycisphaerales bacterium]
MKKRDFARRCSRYIWLIAAAAVTLSTGIAHAQHGDTSNAATWYQRAWEQQWRITNEEWFALDAFRTQGGKPSEEVRAVLRKIVPLLDDARRATKLGFADFSVLPGDPEGHRVEHTSKLRSIIRWIDADVKAKIADGDTMGAASQMASMYRLIAHAGDGRTMVSSLISAAMINTVESTLDFAMEDRALGQAELATVLGAMEALDQRDPFQVVNGIAWEQAALQQLMQEYQQSGVDPSVEGLLKLTGFTPEGVSGIEDFSPAQMLQEVTAYHDLLGQFITIHESDDPQWAAQEIERLKAAAANGELGPLCTAAVPMMTRVYEARVHWQAILDGRKAQLKGLLQGEVDELDLANAAAYYRRGIALLHSIEAPWEEVMVRLRAPEQIEPDTPEANLYEEERRLIDAALAQFTQGSLIRRCDFSTRRMDEEHFIPDYAPGMHLGFLVLLAEAMTLEETGRDDEALAHLATCFRVVHHLGSDGLLLSAVEAQEAFVNARRIAEHLIDSENAGEGAKALDPERLAELAAAIRRTGPRDPFGYQAAMQQINDKTDRYLLGRIAFEFDEWQEDAVVSPAHAAAAKRAREWLQGLGPAERWYLFGLIMLNDEPDMATNKRVRSRAERYGRLTIAAITDLAEIDAQTLPRVCRTGRFEDLTLPPVEQLLDVSARQERARLDQREGAKFAESITAIGRSLMPHTIQLVRHSTHEWEERR